MIMLTASQDQVLSFPAKALRSKVIAEWMERAGYQRAVCFSCGNAAAALRERSIYVIEVGPSAYAMFRAVKWMTPEEIHRVFPDCFDATSGHLPMPLMCEVAQEFEQHLGPASEWQEKMNIDDTKEILVPTGSGETITCLRMAYGQLDFVAMYGLNEATRYEREAPLNGLVSRQGRIITLVPWQEDKELLIHHGNTEQGA